MNAEKRKREFKNCVRLLIWSGPVARKLRWSWEDIEVMPGTIWFPDRLGFLIPQAVELRLGPPVAAVATYGDLGKRTFPPESFYCAAHVPRWCRPGRVPSLRSCWPRRGASRLARRDCATT